MRDRSLLLALLLLPPCGRSFAAQVRVSAGTTRAASPVGAPAAGAAVQGSLGPQALSLPSLSLGALSPAALPPSVQVQAPAAMAQAPVLALPVPAVPVLAPAAPAAAGPSVSPRVRFSEKIQSLSAATAEAGRLTQAPSQDGGRGAADQQFAALTGEKNSASGGLADASDILASQRPRFAPGTLEGVRRADAAIVGAVDAAVGSLLAPGSFQVRSRGSSARLTFSDPNPDYDLMVRLPEAWSQDDFAGFLRQNLPALKSGLAKAMEERAAALFPGGSVSVGVGGPVALTDPATGKPSAGVAMLPVQVRGPSGALLLDIDVSFTIRPEYANAYPDYFADQLRQVERLAGPAAADRVLDDIRLAKAFFQATLGSYKPWHGGPSGVGVEQLIMQSGKVQDSDLGRTILEPGSFDKFMARVAAVGVDGRGQPRGFKKSRELWRVHNPFMAPASFLDLMGESAWSKLVQASRKYQAAKAEGRPIAFAELRPEKAPAALPAASFEPEVPIVELSPPLVLSLAWSSDLNQRRTELLAAAAVRRLKAGGFSVVSARISRLRAGSARTYSARLELGPAADAQAAAQAFRQMLSKADPSAEFDAAAAASPAPALAPAVLLLRPRASSSEDKARGRVEKAGERFARSLGLAGRVSVSPRPNAEGAYEVGLPLAAGAAREEFARAAAAFFKADSGFSLLGVAFPGTRAAAPAAAGPGRLTLELLEKFTLNGPRPEARGAEFLYAQGAKPLPAGLEQAWKARGAEPPLPAGPDTEVKRTLLLRRGTKTFVLMDAFNDEGMPVKKPVKVPQRLAQGIVSDTLVEVALVQGAVRAVRSIGAYPADMVIGRVVRQGAGLALGPLFSEQGVAKGLYAAMPLQAGQAQAREGDILQVFVRPAAAGFEAVPLLDLGGSLTPEIAAREIALRHGARGYVEEGVIRQAEEIGRSQDPAADFARLKSAKGRIEDLSRLPFITIDPVGAGDLDDAYYIERAADGSYTWYLATADVAQYVRPGTPAFAAAAKIGNTFYSIDKDGVPEYPMNHPVVSKYVASLLAGKDSLAMISRMRFSPQGEFLLEDSDVFLGRVRVQGRYTYDQVAELWQGRPGHGIAHPDQVALARELSAKLDARDGARGKLTLAFTQLAHRPQADGSWKTEVVKEDPLESESHHLIEELKVYGNRVIATRLNRISSDFRVPHISRVHPQVEEETNEKLRKQLKDAGLPWSEDQTLWQYLAALRARTDVSAERKEVAQILALRTRNSASYAVSDEEGHEGLALEAGEYDHPSTPIRRFSDMYNRAILEAYLEGGDPGAVRGAVEADLQAMGFAGLEEYMEHLNGREQAARQMDNEVEAFMSVYELAKPENKGRTFTGYVKVSREGRNAQAVIQLRELPVTVTLDGEEAAGFSLLDEVTVTVQGADPAALKVTAAVQKKR